MASTYKDIIITPFRADANNDPVIKFSSGDATSNVDMNVRFYATSNGTLSFEGTSGQLFSVTNDLTGTIFSVNDISGIPSIEVDAAGKISMAHFGGNVGIGTANATSKLHVVGTANISSTITASGVDLLSNDYSTYLMAKGGIDGANTINTTQTTNITNLTTGLTGSNTNITNLTTGLTGANTNLSGNVAIFTGAFTGSNTRLSGSESNVLALQGGLSGSNTNITNLTTGLTGANTNITLRATLANPTFTGVVNIPNLTLTAVGGIEGGQLDLANAITNTTITTGVAIDIYGDKVRIFEKGGTNRGAYLDLSAASVGIGSNLLAGSSTEGSNTVSEPISYIVQSYVTSSINTYPIGTTVSSVNNVSVYLNGVYQNKNQYVLSNSSSNVQFTDTTLPTALSLEIVTIGAPTILSSHIVQSYVTSSINTYPIGVTVSSVNNVFVHLNGVYQNKNQYVLSNSSSNVQFTDATLTSSLSLEIITIR